ncbi:MAG: hypothetical protein NW241_08760 [Bacteroidia bacterium]|nr:hypothetical protein [Bacteroidia bacterium]
MKSLFLTYNEGSQAGKNTALRMQAIASLYGMQVVLPARLGRSSTLDEETAQRIQNSAFVVSFGLEALSPHMQQELAFAMGQQKPIVMLYDPAAGKTVRFGTYRQVTEVPIDYQNTDRTLHEVAEFLNGYYQTRPKEQDQSGTGVALLGVALGLLALWAITRE